MNGTLRQWTEKAWEELYRFFITTQEEKTLPVSPAERPRSARTFYHNLAGWKQALVKFGLPVLIDSRFIAGGLASTNYYLFLHKPCGNVSIDFPHGYDGFLRCNYCNS